MRNKILAFAAALVGMTVTYFIGVTTGPAVADKKPQCCVPCPTTAPPATGGPTGGPQPPVTVEPTLTAVPTEVPTPTPSGSVSTSPFQGPPPVVRTPVPVPE